MSTVDSLSAPRRAQKLFSQRPGRLVLPSILDCDFARLADVFKEMEAAGVSMVHFDVMDGHFVPNLSYGPVLIRALRPLTTLPFDCHLMISDPGKYLDEFCRAGADIITIHSEAVEAPRPVLERIRKHGLLAGLAINPPTPVHRIAPLLEAADLVLCMSVMPGFGGQKFDSVALDKFRWLRKNGPPSLLLESDGGINRDTIAEVRDAGCDLFIVGSALFRAPHFKDEYQILQSMVTHAHSPTLGSR